MVLCTLRVVADGGHAVSQMRERCARGARRLGRAVLLMAALLAWEVLLARWVAGEVSLDAALVRRLAVDAVLLLPLALVALGARDAARASLFFFLLLLPLSVGRGLLAWRDAREAPEAVTPGQAVFASRPVEAPEGRFLCAAAGPEASGGGAPVEEVSAVSAAWAGAGDAVLLHLPVFPLLALAGMLRRRDGRGRVMVAAVPLALLVAASMSALDARLRVEPVHPGREEEACPGDAPVRRYSVVALAVDLPLNAWGDHFPRGLMYALQEDIPAVREQERRPWRERVRGPLRSEPLQPLVLRANVGECLVLRFTNGLEAERATLRVQGLRAAVGGARGAGVPGTALAPGESLTLVLPLPAEVAAQGVYLLHDPVEGGTREARGLFGALVLEPAGSVYRHASTGEPLPRGHGWEAIIDVPEGAGRDFREAVLLFHALGVPGDADVRSAGGVSLPRLDEMAGTFQPGTFGVNYRSEPHFERDEYLPEGEAERPVPAEARHVLPQPRTYLGEPMRVRVLHAGGAELHVPHLHGLPEREWRRLHSEPSTSPGAARLLGPGQGLTLAFGEGHARFPEAAGHFGWSCHMPNHALGGVRGFWHVYAGPRADLAPLPDRTLPR